MSKFLKFGWLLTAVITSSAGALSHADETASSESRTFWSRFGATLGADFDLGNLGNTSIGVPSRTMDAVSIEGMAGYRVRRFTLGLDLDYRWENQLSSLSSGKGTNLQGRGWLLGLGGKYDIAPRWSVQAAIDFVGNYTFSNQTSTSEDDRLENPIVVRAKGQYFAFENLPLSFDLDLQYLSYGKWHVSTTDYNSATTGFFAGVGVTWHFGERFPVTEQALVVSNPPDAAMTKDAITKDAVTKEVIVAQNLSDSQIRELKTELEKIVEVKKSKAGLMVTVKGDASFASGNDQLTPESKANMLKTAEILAKNPGTKIRIEGHSDSTGNKEKNQVLSEARANSVKEVFISAGLKAEDVTVRGMGQTRPIANNWNEEGRAMNRRVEIYIGE